MTNKLKLIIGLSVAVVIIIIITVLIVTLTNNEPDKIFDATENCTEIRPFIEVGDNKILFDLSFCDTIPIEAIQTFNSKSRKKALAITDDCKSWGVSGSKNTRVTAVEQAILNCENKSDNKKCYLARNINDIQAWSNRTSSGIRNDQDDVRNKIFIGQNRREFELSECNQIPVEAIARYNNKTQSKKAIAITDNCCSWTVQTSNSSSIKAAEKAIQKCEQKAGKGSVCYVAQQYIGFVK